MSGHLRRTFSWLINRLQEKSTMAALVTVFATFTGRHLDPDLADSITTTGMLIAGMIGVATKENCDRE